MISLGWFLTHCELAAGEQARLLDTLSEREKTQRAAACSGLRIISPQDMWQVCSGGPRFWRPPGKDTEVLYPSSNKHNLSQGSQKVAPRQGVVEYS